MILKNWFRIRHKIQTITMKPMIKCNRTILKDNKIKITIRKINRDKIERNKLKKMIFQIIIILFN
jgi:hypothetical protein